VPLKNPLPQIALYKLANTVNQTYLGSVHLQKSVIPPNHWNASPALNTLFYEQGVTHSNYCPPCSLGEREQDLCMASSAEQNKRL
jgi:hypothetical protein